MLLYSTILKIADTLDQDAFIQLVIEWNQKSPHTANAIPKINWHGERNIRYGNESLYLDIEEYRNKNIIAVRYHQVAEDGAIWNTDFIMNFDEMKMAIQLDRSYDKDASIDGLNYSVPYFVTLLIDGGFIRDDNGLPVGRTAVFLTDSNVGLLTDIINRKKMFQLPIIYVSKTISDENPCNIKWLCRDLKGIAHVLVEEAVKFNSLAREVCDDKNPYLGAIGIYYPNGYSRRFIYSYYSEGSNALAKKVIRAVAQYMNIQKIPDLYTWQGVSNSLLLDRLDSQRAKTELEHRQGEAKISEYVEAFDEDNRKLQEQIKELTKENTSLREENRKLRSKMNDLERTPLLYFGDEEDFYTNEIKEMVLDCVNEVLKKSITEHTRRYDVLHDVITQNRYQNLTKQRSEEVKCVFNDYSSMTSKKKQQIKNLGFTIASENRHYRLIYFDDPRYKTTLSKTGSDRREGKNTASNIIKNMM